MSQTDGAARPLDKKRRSILPWLVFGGSLAVAFGLGMLVVSIMERRWEAVQPQFIVKPIGAWETDDAKWGQNYPREYETFLKTKITDTRTRFGGAYPRDYLHDDPTQVVLFAGYGFSRDYKQARGHYWAVHDIKESKRTTRADGSDTGMPGTCWTCKSQQVPSVMNTMGVEAFYNASYKELKPKLIRPIGCLDCHDPKTMNLRVSRPALREAYARQGKDIDQVDHQEMRSLVCAQCHVEYYFGNSPKDNQGARTFARKGRYLVFPWDRGTGVEAIESYFAERPEFYDWVHPVSGTRMIKMQHPDWEVYRTGIHAYRQVSCADCHMPYHTEGGVKFTSHHVQSPLLDISTSCAVCHRWSEDEVRSRVEQVQAKQHALKLMAQTALVRAHFDVAACKEAGVGDEELKPLRELVWRAQLRWDYVSANNGMGFHSPQECVRVLGTSIQLAQEARIGAARLLAARGHTSAPAYPEIATRDQALAVITAFEAAASSPGQAPPPLLGAAKPEKRQDGGQ